MLHACSKDAPRMHARCSATHSRFLVKQQMATPTTTFLLLPQISPLQPHPTTPISQSYKPHSTHFVTPLSQLQKQNTTPHSHTPPKPLTPRPLHPKNHNAAFSPPPHPPQPPPDNTKKSAPNTSSGQGRSIYLRSTLLLRHDALCPLADIIIIPIPRREVRKRNRAVTPNSANNTRARRHGRRKNITTIPLRRGYRNRP